MTFNSLKRMALQLINRYSIGGRVIPDEYNSQMDVILELVTLTNEGMEYIATTNKRIRETAEFDTEILEIRDGHLILPVPPDFYEMIPGAVTFSTDGHERKIRSVKRRGKEMWIPAREFRLHADTGIREYGPAGKLIIDYYRHSNPMAVGDNGMPLEPDAELDNTPDTHGALACYVAAHLSIYDDAYTHAALYNEWETKLARIKEEPWTEIGIVEDDYSPFNYSFY